MNALLDAPAGVRELVGGCGFGAPDSAAAPASAGAPAFPGALVFATELNDSAARFGPLGLVVGCGFGAPAAVALAALVEPLPDLVALADDLDELLGDLVLR